MGDRKKLYYVSPYLFFLIKDAKIIVWDYKLHQQYEIEQHHFDRLLQLSSLSCNHDIVTHDDELFSVGLLTEKEEKLDWGWDDLSKIFHFGTSMINCDTANQDPHLFINEYIAYCSDRFSKEISNDTSNRSYIKKITLPSPRTDFLTNVDFLSTLKNRKTCRSFVENKTMSLDELSSLLYVSFGNFHLSDNDYETHGYQKIGMRKTSPSGGGLHPTATYLLANKIVGLKSGVYYYSPKEHTLLLLNTENGYASLKNMLCEQYFYENTPFGIFLTSQFDKLWHKYPHSRAYRVALMDVGHVSQTFQLVATAMGLKTWLSGAFHDQAVRTFLKISNVSEQPLLFLTCGNSLDNSALDCVAKAKKVVQE